MTNKVSHLTGNSLTAKLDNLLASFFNCYINFNKKNFFSNKIYLYWCEDIFRAVGKVCLLKLRLKSDGVLCVGHRTTKYLNLALFDSTIPFQ